jgi:hypothetical protein
LPIRQKFDRKLCSLPQLVKNEEDPFLKGNETGYHFKILKILYNSAYTHLIATRLIKYIFIYIQMAQ